MKEMQQVEGNESFWEWLKKLLGLVSKGGSQTQASRGKEFNVRTGMCTQWGTQKAESEVLLL